MNIDADKMTKTPKRMGNIMLLMAWILAIALGTSVVQQWLNHRNNPNQRPLSSSQQGVHQVILQPNPQHHYLTSGTINGTEVTFLIDTGATNLGIPASVAKSLGLKALGTQISDTANGTVTSQTTEIQHLSIGPIQLEKVRGSIMPNMSGNEILLGMNVLKNIEFSSQNGQLTLKQYTETATP